MAGIISQDTTAKRVYRNVVTYRPVPRGKGNKQPASQGMRKFLAAIQDGLTERHAVFESPINRKLMISIERHHAIRALKADTEKHGRVVRNVVVEKIRKSPTQSAGGLAAHPLCDQVPQNLEYRLDTQKARLYAIDIPGQNGSVAGV